MSKPTPQAPTKPLTLAELDAEDTPTPAPEEQEEEQEEETEEEQEEEEPEEEEAPKPVKKPRAKKAAAPKPEDDETDDDGEDPEDEDEDPEEDETPEGEDDGSFWDEVDQLRGEPLEVDYGDVDPETPQGALLREKAVEDHAISNFEEAIKKKSPKAYAYLVHAVNGGTEEEFFKKTEGVDALPSEADLEVDVDVQREVIRKELKARGNTERQIKAILKDAEENDELEEMSKEALTHLEASQAKVLKQIEDDNAAALAERTQKIESMVGYVEKVVATGKLGNINIPKTDRKAFADQFTKSIRYEDGKFLAVTELSDDNLEDVFKKEYFQYKKGDLEGLIERKARSENTKRLTRKINTNPRPKSTSTRTTGFTLGDL